MDKHSQATVIRGGCALRAVEGEPNLGAVSGAKVWMGRTDQLFDSLGPELAWRAQAALGDVLPGKAA
ncbi:hypothetical protein BVI434_1720011 [Burkholderia vietnamiensis]|nr:hypothetical protein BVI434_1720011 [Burkholderia vietnamiensis]